MNVISITRTLEIHAADAALAGILFIDLSSANSLSCGADPSDLLFLLHIPCGLPLKHPPFKGALKGSCSKRSDSEASIQQIGRQGDTIGRGKVRQFRRSSDNLRV